MTTMRVALCMVLLSSAASAAKLKPNIVMIVADDLGYNDLGIRNGNKTHTPVLNELIATGVTLSSYVGTRV